MLSEGSFCCDIVIIRQDSRSVGIMFKGGLNPDVNNRVYKGELIK